jgi:hypothetical protein
LRQATRVNHYRYQQAKRRRTVKETEFYDAANEANSSEASAIVPAAQAGSWSAHTLIHMVS